MLRFDVIMFNNLVEFNLLCSVNITFFFLFEIREHWGTENLKHLCVSVKVSICFKACPFLILNRRGIFWIPRWSQAVLWRGKWAYSRSALLQVTWCCVYYPLYRSHQEATMFPALEVDVYCLKNSSEEITMKHYWVYVGGIPVSAL